MARASSGAGRSRPPRTLRDVPGWISPTDRALFEHLLQMQVRTGRRGDLVELGVYLGKSAIVMGGFLQPEETFTVCDLFDLARQERSVLPGVRRTYADLTQAAFERNYLAFHDRLPVVLRGTTDMILDHVAPRSCRFIHVDASHLYDHVRGDLLSAKKLLRDDGIVVFDDYRTAHTPGTAAAVWEGVANEGLRVVCVSDGKFYGTWGDPGPIQDSLIAWAAAGTEYACDSQPVRGQRLIRVRRRGPAKLLPDRSLRGVTIALAPPVATRLVTRLRGR